MRARLVLENMNFERGIDPREAMSIGNPEARAKTQMKRALEELVKEFGNECRYRIVKDKSWDAIKGYFYYDPSDEKWWYPPIIFIIVYFPDSDQMMVYPAKRWHVDTHNNPEIKYEVKRAEEAKQKIKGWISQNPKAAFDIIDESLNFERGIDPKDSMELGDVEGREKKRKKAEFALRRDEIYDAAKKLKAKFSTPQQTITTTDEISFYKVTFRTRKKNTYILEVTYYAPRYELTLITSRGREDRLAFETIDTLIRQVEFFEKHSNMI